MLRSFSIFALIILTTYSNAEIKNKIIQNLKKPLYKLQELVLLDGEQVMVQKTKNLFHKHQTMKY